jgi:hypothetical protein
MLLASPIWLTLLFPWTALAIWLLSGRRQKQPVPFLELWRAEAAHIRRPHRYLNRPPLALALALLALLIAILASAGPEIRNPATISSDPTQTLKIERFAIRTGPTTQAMVRISNESDLAAAELTIRADGKTAYSAPVQLAPRSEPRDYFVEVPISAATFQAVVDFGGGKTVSSEPISAAPWPRIIVKGPIPPDLQRMIDIYTRRRTPDDNSTTVFVKTASDVSSIPDGPAALALNETAATRSLASLGSVVIHDHPLTRSVDWNSVLSDASTEPPPPGEWTPLVSVGSLPIVAVREDPIHQVWVGFDSAEFSHRPDFVVFWTNIFQWLGGGADISTSGSPPTEIPSPVPQLPASRSIAGQTLLASFALLCLSAALWKPTPSVSAKAE